MKFRLDEALFNLKEPIYLQERYILTEGKEELYKKVDYAPIRKVASKIISYKKDFDTVIYSIKNNPSSKLRNEDYESLETIYQMSELVLKGLSRTKNLNNLKTPINTMIASMDELVRKYSSKTSEAGMAHVSSVIKLVDSIKKAAEFKNPKEDKKTLIILLNSITDDIIKIIDTNGWDEIPGEEAAKKYKIPNKSINDQLKIIQNTYDLCEKLAKNSDETILATIEKELLPALTELLKTLENGATTRAELFTACEKFLNSYNNMRVHEDTAREAQDQDKEDEWNNKQLKSSEWNNLFKQMGDTTDFWTKYYREFWGPSAETIKNYGIAFKQECRKYGFTEASNPFIVYLKNLKKLPTVSAYTTIHNLTAQFVIKRSDLIKSTPISLNVIYNSELLSKTNSEEIEEYILTQDALSSETNIPEVSEEDPTYMFLKKIRNHIANSAEQTRIGNYILYINPGSDFNTAKLRDLTTIRNLLELFNGKSVYKSKSVISASEAQIIPERLLKNSKISLKQWILWLFTSYNDLPAIAAKSDIIKFIDSTINTEQSLYCTYAFNKACGNKKLTNNYIESLFSTLLSIYKDTMAKSDK